MKEKETEIKKILFKKWRGTESPTIGEKIELAEIESNGHRFQEDDKLPYHYTIALLKRS